MRGCLFEIFYHENPKLTYKCTTDIAINPSKREMGAIKPYFLWNSIFCIRIAHHRYNIMQDLFNPKYSNSNTFMKLSIHTDASFFAELFGPKYANDGLGSHQNILTSTNRIDI